MWDPQTGKFEVIDEQLYTAYSRVQGMRTCTFNTSIQKLRSDLFAGRLQEVFANAESASARCTEIANLICQEFGGDVSNWTESVNPCKECVKFVNNANISRLELTSPQLFRCTCASGLQRGNEQVSRDKLFPRKASPVYTKWRPCSLA